MAKKRYNNKRFKSKSYRERNPYSPLWLIPVLFIIGILPLIVFGKVLEIDGLEEAYWRGGSTHLDFFSYYKAMYFIVASYIGLVIVIIMKWLNLLDYVKTKYYIPLIIYAVFAILSSFRAADSTVAIRGFMEMFQGVFVLVGYAITIAVVINLVRYEEHLKVIVGAFIFIGSVIALLGVTQFFGFDFFRTDFGKMLILPASLHSLADTLQFTFGPHRIYATMYNTNFVGSFAALMVPLSIVLFFYASNTKYRVYTGLFFSAMVFVAFGSNSRAGLIGLSGGMILMAIFFRKELLKKPFRVGIALVIVIVQLFGLDFVSGGRILRQVTSLNIFEEVEQVTGDVQESAYFHDVILDEFSITIVTDKLDFNAQLIDDDGTAAYAFLDEEGNRLTVVNEGDGLYTFNHEDYKDSYSVTIGSTNLIIHAYRKDIRVQLTSEGFNVIGFRGELLDTIEQPPRFKLLDGYEKIFTSRGFIWSRSIPMLGDTLLLGHGPDMYAIEYPQNDFVGRLNGIENSIIDKPHNMYLQIGINTGVISLLALLSIYLFYFLDSARLYFKLEYTKFVHYIGVGVFVSVMSYLGAAMFNDQIISVAPLFYVMVGFGISINRLLAKEQELY